jgi:hypothetical protein
VVHNFKLGNSHANFKRLKNLMIAGERELKHSIPRIGNSKSGIEHLSGLVYSVDLNGQSGGVRWRTV